MKYKTKHVDVSIKDPDGTIVFERKNIEAPDSWSDRAVTIAASKYFAHNENSIFTMVGRVVRQIKLWGEEQGYFDSEEEAHEFMNYLEELLLDQRGAFNSPVWFNVGVAENNSQTNACFIYGVEDNMEDILTHTIREGLTFKWGSGTGVNVSKLRAEGELLSNKGKASGPLGFMKIWDQTAGSIKSGGKTRRAAKLVCMDIDHPDIEDFIECKGKEEDKAKILIAGGVDPEEAYQTVAFQNSNHSVMISDDFMTAVKQDSNWELINRGDRKVAKIVKARELFRKIAEVAWKTGDPGVQFKDRINQDNPIPSVGPIESSNPCSEFMAPNNSARSLASLNLVKYLKENKSFNEDLFQKDIEHIITAMDILIDKSDFPTKEAKKMAMESRPLGLGFSNLGAYCMLKGWPYDSYEARNFAQYTTWQMTRFAYITSSELAKKLGPYKYYKSNKEQNINIVKRLTKSDTYITENYIEKYGLRNSQVTLLAPCGTIGFLMDCDSTGIEPLFARKSYKSLAGGGTIELIPECVTTKLEELVNSPVDYSLVEEFISGNKEWKETFATANEISPLGHIAMMEACQPHLNGSISKTVNISNSSTVEDVMGIYHDSYKMGLKAVAIYRDGSKALQPLNIKKEDKKEVETEEDLESWVAYRRRLPETIETVRHKFNICGLEGYVFVGLYEDGTPGEMFIKTKNQGSTMDGILDGFATAVSYALQYGVPSETLVNKFIGSRFEPAGYTGQEDIPIATSVLDYIFKWFKLTFLDEEDEEQTEIPQTEETPKLPEKVSFDGPPCMSCGSITCRNGKCFVCPTCGTGGGCEG